MKISYPSSSSTPIYVAPHPYIGLFLHNENQTILWKTICKSSSWNTFTRVIPMSPETWFRNIIEQRYTEILSEPRPDPLVITRVQWLRQTNINTIERLVSSIMSYMSPASTATEIASLPPASSNMPSNMMSFSHTNMDKVGTINAIGSISGTTYGGATTYMEETPTLVYTAPRKYDTPAISAFDVERERKEKQERAKREFESYQSQYNSLLARPVPTTPVFSEIAQPEERITNMDELLKQQHAMREQDVAAILPPPPTKEAMVVSTTPETSPFVDRDNIKHEVLEAVLRNTEPTESNTKKNVSWEVNM